MNPGIEMPLLQEKGKTFRVFLKYIFKKKTWDLEKHEQYRTDIYFGPYNLIFKVKQWN